MNETSNGIFYAFGRFFSKAPDAVTPVERTQPGGKSGKRSHSETSSVSKPVGKESGGQVGWLREVVEAIAIALVLAFLFRSFEAEAFVIPTGSMAPTLMGRHKDVICDSCGFRFQVGASEEVDKITNRPTGRWVIGGTCPNCRHTLALGSNRSAKPSTPSFKGDRILVSKYAYHLAEPKRWDVVVFKYPGGATTNFIKRLIGMPNETVRIFHGDIFVKKQGEEEFSIARKPPKKVLAMLQPVYDDDNPSQILLDAGWPERWSEEATPAAGSAAAWRLDVDKREWECRAPQQEVAWLHYRHIIPDWDVWQAITDGRPIAIDAARPQLISDFVSYNTNEAEDTPFAPIGPPRGDQLGLHWVGDLAVEFEAELQNVQSGGELRVELVKGGRVFRAVIDAVTGEARLEGLGDDITHDMQADRQDLRSFTTRLQGSGRHRVRLANVDDQLILWVDGGVIVFPYQVRAWQGPTREDLERPIRIGGRGVDMKVRHLKVFRDIYYIAHDARSRSFMHDFDWSASPYARVIWSGDAMERFRKMVGEVMSDPQQWDFFATGHALDFELKDDQFFVLGDNSAQSEDGRFWTKEHFVRRELLVGKALAVIWPHALNHLPGTSIPFPLFPNFGDMRIVR
ncbi:signal peptidase I [Thermopirellula anaerolimosa]